MQTITQKTIRIRCPHCEHERRIMATGAGKPIWCTACERPYRALGLLPGHRPPDTTTRQPIQAPDPAPRREVREGHELFMGLAWMAAIYAAGWWLLWEIW